MKSIDTFSPINPSDGTVNIEGVQAAVLERLDDFHPEMDENFNLIQPLEVYIEGWTNPRLASDLAAAALNPAQRHGWDIVNAEIYPVADVKYDRFGQIIGDFGRYSTLLLQVAEASKEQKLAAWKDYYENTATSGTPTPGVVDEQKSA